MKTKKYFSVALVIVLIFAIAVFSACVNEGKASTVTFVGADVASVEVESGKAMTKPSDPTREGYDFEGWFTAEGKEWNFDDPVESDMTLTAHWEAKHYTITLSLNGGTLDGGSTEVEVVYDENYTLPVPSMGDIRFMGWTIDNTAVTDLEGKSLTSYKFARNSTAIASWTFTQKSGFIYQLNKDDTLTVTAAGGFAYDENLKFESEIEGKKVSAIGDMSKLTAREVTVPESVEKIADGAFENNIYLREMDLSAFKGTIGDRAFTGSRLRYIDLGGTVSIGDNAFVNTNLALLYVPSSVTSVGAGAFDSADLVEIGFEANFPALGERVFGDGTRNGDDGSVTIIASEKAWDALVATQAENLTFAQKVEAATGVQKASLFTWTDSMIAEGKEVKGRYEGDVLVYMGMGLNAVIADGNAMSLESVFDGKESCDHIYDFSDGKKTVYLDRNSKTTTLLEANENGEVIKDNVLYDYIGSSLTYKIPDNITAIAGGAGQLNYDVRFLILGDNVTSVGSFAFSSGQLFGISIGKNVQEIADYAFFDQNYLTQLIFCGSEKAPHIGQAAFSVFVTGGYAPFTLNQMAQYGVSVKIYLEKEVQSYDFESWQYVPGEGAIFMDALNASLEGLNLVKVGYEGDSEEDYKDASYLTADFTTFRTSGFVAKDTVYSGDLGTITMSGADNGYAYIDFDEDSGYSGSSYLYFSGMPGYSFSYSDDESVPLRIQVFTGFDTEGLKSTLVYGQFKEGELVLRGAEAGTYGKIKEDYFIIDGYGGISYHKADGSVEEGSYTLSGNTLNIRGIDGVSTLTVDFEKQEITFGGNTLYALGEEAGVYYDLAHRAKLELDGVSYMDRIADEESGESATIYYSGTMTLLYNGKTETLGYIINGTKLSFILDGVNKEWTFSRTSAHIVSGYYDENYTYYLEFGEEEPGLKDTFTNGSSSLTLDGFFTATLDDKEYGYFIFEQSLLLFDNENVTIYNLDTDAKTFAVANAPEAGMYYVNTSADYRLFIDGKGSLLYDNGSYNIGTYSYDAATKQLDAWIGNKENATQKGNLDTQSGCGMISYYSGYSDTIMAISKQPFTRILSYKTVRVYFTDGDGITSESPSFDAYVSNNMLFISTYGAPVAIYDLSSAELTFEYIYKTARIEVKVRKQDDSYSVELAFKCASVETIQATVDGESKSLIFCWLNDEKTELGIYENESWQSNVVCGKVEWDASKTSFTIGGYRVSGYPSDVTISTIE